MDDAEKHLWSCAKVVLGINGIGFGLTALTQTHKLTDLLVRMGIRRDAFLGQWCRELGRLWRPHGTVMSDVVRGRECESSNLLPVSC